MAITGKIISGSGTLLVMVIVLFFSIHSPASISAAEPVIPPGPLGAPFRVAAYTEQLLLVSDYNSGSIFSVSKSDPSQVGEKFKIDGNPLAVGSLEGDILVGNSSSGSIHVYNSVGGLEYTIDGMGIDIFPSDFAMDHQLRQVFVVDSNAHEVKVYRKKSSFLVFGKNPIVTVSQRIHFHDSFGAEVLINPVGIALDQSEKVVYVSDQGDPMNDVPPIIHIFTYAGLKIDELDSTVFSDYRPRGLAYGSGKLYVTDALTCEIAVIDLITKTRLGTLGEYGSAPGQLMQPQDVSVDPSGESIYVANKRLGRIEKIVTGDLLP
ncbi:MAG: hypothetical protein K9K37_06090 [Desulfocapsa sp.]|nr:hypothetical protein [Desulfocapsa sp.]